KLAAASLELTQHYVAPVCSPTRTGLTTGRCWSRYGVTTPINERALPPDTVTLAGALRTRGYQTCLIGKWHLGSKPEWGPNHYGFDHAYGSLAGGVSPWNHRYKQGPFSVTWHRNGELLEESGHVTDLLADEAVQWIESHHQSPFFLYVPFTAVHLPLREPQPWLDQVPPSIEGEVPRHYAACIMHLDHAVGRIVDALEKAGVRDNTLLVFTSDNGGSTAANNTQPYPDDDCPAGKIPGNNRPLRGEKGAVYEGGIRVPTLVSWPGNIQPRRNATPAFICDWMPTLCELADYQPPRDLHWDGVSIASLLMKDVPPPERSIYIAGPRERTAALRRGDWKLVAHGEGSSQKFELYNIPADISEKTNLAAQHPERVEQLKTILAEYRGH
ncbi:MAG: sulfatase-like hydrolase/transferase, partial [Planctomycetales bacterium]|nr:sulfatase-like hydrolase/transferase [Planctomycetales bacterium]